MTASLRLAKESSPNLLAAPTRSTKWAFSTPKRERRAALCAGEVGYVVAGIKDIRGAPVGDTLLDAKHPNTPPVPGFETV